MTITTAQQAIIQRLIDTPSAPPIGLPNRAAPAIPAGGVRWIVQKTPGSILRRYVDGTRWIRAEINVRVEMLDGQYAGPVEASIAVIDARFAPNTRFGSLVVIDPPDPKAGMTDGGVYSVPVYIRAETY